MRIISDDERIAARAIGLRWRGRRVDLLGVDEAAGTAWLVEIDSGFALYVAVTGLTWMATCKPGSGLVAESGRR